MVGGDFWPQVGQLAPVVVVVIAMARWVWGIERDMIRRYAARSVELEKQCAALEGEADYWRRRYWLLVAVTGRQIDGHEEGG